MYEKAKYLVSGDSAVTMEFGNIISEEINKKIRAVALAIEIKNIYGIMELVPSYRSLMIHYNPLKVNFSELVDALKNIEENLDNIKLPAPEVLEIPTLYGGEWGPDIEGVAKHNNITAKEVVEIHTSREYLIFMLGFTPGFPYLGGMDTRIAAPRLKTPRTRIPGGSVGIAGEQTGIYPVSSPGGWQLIGSTPIKLFDPLRENPILLKSGNYIKFKSINVEEYEKIKQQSDNGTYEYITYPKRTEGLSMGQFKIVEAGFLTTVQDLGRYGYQQYGVSVSGAMDHVAAKLANILVGNEVNEDLLEVTMIGPKIEFLDAAVIAITGGNLQPAVNGKSLELNTSIAVHKGDFLSFKGMKNGLRSYIAFAGGIDVPVVMDSKSTFLKAQIGGYEGRNLKAGDLLNTGTAVIEQSGKEVAQDFYDYNNHNGKVELRVVLGPQDDDFTENGIETFFNSEFRVSNNCDRMGYTLEGEKIEHKDGADIISDGISMGAIQVPSSGNPIIMMADRQTTGGYTKIANVINVDLPKVAQSKPGDVIVFIKSTIQEAHMLMKDLEKRIDEVKKQLSAQNIKKTEKSEIINIKNFNVKVNGKSYAVKIEEL